MKVLILISDRFDFKINIKDKNPIAGIYAGPMNLPILQISSKNSMQNYCNYSKKVFCSMIKL